jgi:hypothetical protein
MRRLTRYSIRSLLVLVTLACVVLGWYVANRNVRQREVVAIEELGKLNPHGLLISTVEENSTRCWGSGSVSGVATARLSGLQWLTSRFDNRSDNPFFRVVQISLWEPFDDRAIPHLAQLKSLEDIDFYYCGLSEEGKVSLRDLFPEASINYDAFTDLAE